MKKLFVVLAFLLTVSSFAQKGLGMFGKDPIINLENFDKQRGTLGLLSGF